MSTEAVKRGSWSGEEYERLRRFVAYEGEERWIAAPSLARLQRCPMECRSRWMNFLRRNTSLGPITADEEKTILHFHGVYGNQWWLIATKLPGRTAYDVQNYWNKHISKTRAPMAAAASSHSTGPSNSEMSPARSRTGATTSGLPVAPSPRDQPSWPPAGVDEDDPFNWQASGDATFTDDDILSFMETILPEK